MRRTRRIRIGRVVLGHYVERQCSGLPGGMRMEWVGEQDVFQPREFLTWRVLAAAIERRLALAGLECAVAGELRELGRVVERERAQPFQEGFGLSGRRVGKVIDAVLEVRRAVDRRWKRLRRAVLVKFRCPSRTGEPSRTCERTNTNDFEAFKSLFAL